MIKPSEMNDKDLFEEWTKIEKERIDILRDKTNHKNKLPKRYYDLRVEVAIRLAKKFN
jgi:uncharacterized protein YaaN involved in tellurite resistance